MYVNLAFHRPMGNYEKLRGNSGLNTFISLAN